MSICPDCGAESAVEDGCIEYFHQMLYWEQAFPELGVVHHLMVLCYYIQHPHLYSEEGLRGAVELLRQAVDEKISPELLRRQIRERVDSGKRTYRIKASAASIGAHRLPVLWTMTARDVVAGDSEQYIESVEEWARKTLEALRKSGNL